MFNRMVNSLSLSFVSSLFSIFLVSSPSFAESVFPGVEEYVARGCVNKGSDGFAPMAIEACGKKIYCVNAFVECSFVKASALRNNADWKQVTQRPSLDWIRLGSGIFCKMKDGSCDIQDLDACANQSAKEAGCSIRNMPGNQGFTTIPRDGVK